MPLKTYRNGQDSTVVLSINGLRCCEINIDFQTVELYQLKQMMYFMPILTEIAQYRSFSPDMCQDKLFSILDGRGWTKC